jgi:hypothetical protein
LTSCPAPKGGVVGCGVVNDNAHLAHSHMAPPILPVGWPC